MLNIWQSWWTTTPQVIMVVGGTCREDHLHRQTGRPVSGCRQDPGGRRYLPAAASEKLSVWAERLHLPIVAHREVIRRLWSWTGSANAQRIPVVIVDTAGRLYTKQNLLQLGKIRRVIEQNKGDRILRVFLVLDATTGQNAIAQAKSFQEVTGIDGIILTKLDGTAKGGIVLAIADQLQLPIVWIGVGETADDLRPFDPEEFAHALFAEE